MNNVVVYTAIFNDYDWLKDPVVIPKGVDFICYTDSNSIRSKYWIIKKIPLNGKSPSALNREIKLLYPYTELKQYNYSLYVDGSMMIKGDVLEFLKKYIATNPMLMNFQHPNNDCIYEEMKRCIQQKKGDPNKLMEQYRVYKNDYMPSHFGLSDNKIILRDNRSKLGEVIMYQWYRQVIDYSGRDQVCLSYVLYKNKLSYSFFDEKIESNIYFETWPHNVDKWHIRFWRHFKWFCERNNIGGIVIRLLETYIKPLFFRYSDG